MKGIDQINQSQINAQQQAAQSYPNAQDDALPHNDSSDASNSKRVHFQKTAASTI